MINFIRTKHIPGILLTGILLFSCKQQEHPVTASENPLHENLMEQLCTNWAYVSDNVFSYGYLELKKDATFRYEYGGCLGTTYSAGTWSLKENTIVLNSFKRYGPQPVTVNIPPAQTEVETTPVTGTSSPVAGSETFTINVDPSVLSASFSPCFPAPADSGFTFLKDMVLIFENDTLYELSGFMGAKSGIKLRASKNQAL